jgi:prepilin-type N-terminal cleavage/methylation domain-containing protein
VARRHGFSLIEMLIVMVVIGLVSLIALPKMNAAFTHSNMISAKSKLASLYSIARSTAVSSGQTAILRVNGNQVYVYARPRLKAPVGANTIDTITTPTNLSTQFGVTLSGGVDSVRISPNGLGLDSAVIILTKSSWLDTVIISRYGRVLK